MTSPTSSISFLLSLSCVVMQRVYHYCINSHGELFLTTCKIKNTFASFKDVTFLDFILTRIHLNPNPILYENTLYNWISLCGKEENHFNVEQTPIVYQSILNSKFMATSKAFPSFCTTRRSKLT